MTGKGAGKGPEHLPRPRVPCHLGAMSTLAPPAPFDRTAVRAHRARASAKLPDHDFLFAETADRLLERLGDINREFAGVLDLGCRGGRLGSALQARPGLSQIVPSQIVQCDLAPEMAARAHAANGLNTIAADEEWLPFAPESFDLIVSNLALHWVNDLPGALTQIRRALRPDGLFLAAMFGAGTIEQLRTALMAAEIEIEGGASPRVSPFAEVRDAGDLLTRAGFALPVADLDTITVSFESALHLMRDLSAMGEAGAVHERRKNFTRRATLMAAAQHYPTTADERIEATFEVIWLAGWAPGPGQQQPLKPGSAKTRLADHLGATEQPAGDTVPGGGPRLGPKPNKG
ncbi:MAG: NADH dehydrogenase [ubiquinone] 1 alpha subcomplex assembly factor 5 [Alphaproteobacteria bacterium]|jgi:NADH dehydrogenase [ubiquinone] 1 alpha subcomplex assembly factor 5